MYSIYRLTNKINGKVYIGKAKDYKRRWSQHKTHGAYIIGAAIQKYGWGAFTAEVIDTASEPLEALIKETQHIRAHNSLVPNGYNILLFDGKRLVPLESTRVKMSQSGQGKIRSRKGHSKYIGVGKSRWGNAFDCNLQHRKKRYSRQFPTEQQAAIAYDKMALYLFGEKAIINFEKSRESYLASDLKSYHDSFCYQPSRISSGYKGVFWSKGCNKWLARHDFYKDGSIFKRIQFGYYTNPEDAAEARDKCLLHLIGDGASLNFPERKKSYLKEDLNGFYEKIIDRKTSKHRGVSFNKALNKWTANVCFNKVRHYLGRFPTEKEAFQALLAFKAKNSIP